MNLKKELSYPKLINHRTYLERLEQRLAKKKSAMRYYNIECSDTDGIIFHIFLFPSIGEAYISGYPSIIGSGKIEIFRRKGYNPEYGLFFSNVNKNKIQELSAKLDSLDPRDYESKKLIPELSKRLNISEDKFYNMIERNGMIELEKCFKKLKIKLF